MVSLRSTPETSSRSVIARLSLPPRTGTMVVAAARVRSLKAVLNHAGFSFQSRACMSVTMWISFCGASIPSASDFNSCGTLARLSGSGDGSRFCSISAKRAASKAMLRATTRCSEARRTRLTGSPGRMSSMIVRTFSSACSKRDELPSLCPMLNEASSAMTTPARRSPKPDGRFAASFMNGLANARTRSMTARQRRHISRMSRSRSCRERTRTLRLRKRIAAQSVRWT